MVYPRRPYASCCNAFACARRHPCGFSHLAMNEKCGAARFRDMTISQDQRAREAGMSATAVIVAAARAIETNHQDSLVSDVYAEHFVRAAPNSAMFPLRIE